MCVCVCEGCVSDAHGVEQENKLYIGTQVNIVACREEVTNAFFVCFLFLFFPIAEADLKKLNSTKYH